MTRVSASPRVPAMSPVPLMRGIHSPCRGCGFGACIRCIPCIRRFHALRTAGVRGVQVLAMTWNGAHQEQEDQEECGGPPPRIQGA